MPFLLMRTASVFAAGFLLGSPSHAAATAVTGATPSTPASGDGSSTRRPGMGRWLAGSFYSIGCLATAAG
jgi:hypothetical protein